MLMCAQKPTGNQFSLPLVGEENEKKHTAKKQQEAQLMLKTGSTRLAVSRGQQTWYHSTCYIWFPIVQ